ncbi:MAG: lipoyl(octanoyl) transferase LipB [Candidatus Omnitrophota bacterium]|jgi:lipoate-protein ligase B
MINENKTACDWTVEDWDLIGYEESYARQKTAVGNVLAGHGPYLFLCEHPPVITLGRLAERRHILTSADALKQRGIEVIAVDRGGDVTLHAPGQLVVYPVLNLKNFRRDLKWYLDKLEQVAIDLLRDFDILTCRLPGRTGVWLESRKIVSIGVGVKQWVTFHGLAININTDLPLFNLIKPCGLDVQMTSVQKVQGAAVDMQVVKQLCQRHCLRIFNEGSRPPSYAT